MWCVVCGMERVRGGGVVCVCVGGGGEEWGEVCCVVLCCVVLCCVVLCCVVLCCVVLCCVVLCCVVLCCGCEALQKGEKCNPKRGDHHYQAHHKTYKECLLF